MTRSDAFLGAFGVLLLAGAFAFYLFDSGTGQAGDMAAASRISVQPAPGSAAPAPVPASSGTAPTASTEWQPHDSLSVAAHKVRQVADRRVAFERALGTGGGAFTYLADEIQRDCFGVARYGLAELEQLAGRGWAASEAYQSRVDAFRRRHVGCRGFERKPFTPEEMARLERQKKQGEDLVSRAWQSLGKAHDPAQFAQNRQLAREVLESGDIESMALVAAVMARVHVGPMRFSAGPGDPADNLDQWSDEMLAWTIAACSLGADCGPRSRLADDACMWTGVCDAKSVDEVVRKSTGDALHAETQLRRRDEIVRAIRARDWAALGL